MSDYLTHGRILGGVVGTPDVAAALADYRDRLGLALVADGPLDAALARSWGADGLAGTRTATLAPRSDAHCFIRLVEQPVPASFKPTTTYGWGAYEISVQDVFGWPERLAGSGFEVVGQPRIIPGMTNFVAMQMLGRGREMIYLNEVAHGDDEIDLPKAAAPVDMIFIVILATPDRAATVAWYRDRLGLDEGATHTLAYTMINKAFGLPIDRTSQLTMTRKGRIPIVEIDDYPAEAKVRGVAAGQLPPGNALVTLAVDDLDALDLDWIAAPTVQAGPLYGGRRAGTVRGPAGELIELVQISP